MGKKTKTGKGRLDKFYHLAKEQGFRARSAFKLTQLSKQFNLFTRASVCVDLCGAPGGWSQVAVQAMPRGSKVICVDLVPIRPLKGVVTIQSDITTQACRNLIKQELSGKSHVCDVVLNDGAPNVGAAWSKDAYNQAELTLHAFQLACDLLRPGGTFVTKVFRSADYNALLWTFQQLFSKVESTKPSASRAVSAEIFVVCKGYKAPEKVDPKFFNPKFVFMNEVGDNEEDEDEVNAIKQTAALERPSSLSGLLKAIGKRNRGGYAEGDDFRTVTVDQFLASRNPAELLIKCHKILPSGSVDLPETIASSFEDLKVQGKGELYAIMKWRTKVLNEMQKGVSKAAPGKAVAAHEESSDSESQVAHITEDTQHDADSRDLLRLTKSRLAEEKRDLKRQRVKDKKALMRKKMSLDAGVGIAESTSASFEPDLFHLPRNKASLLAAMEDAPVVVDDDGQSGEVDPDLKIAQYVVVTRGDPALMEQYEDDFAQDYASRKNKNPDIDQPLEGSKGKRITRRQQHMAAWANEVTSLVEDTDKKAYALAEQRKPDDAASSDESDAEELSEKQSSSQNMLAERWFSNPIFSSTNHDESEFTNELAEADLPVIPLSDKQAKKLKRKQGKVNDVGTDVGGVEVVAAAKPVSLDEIAEVQALGSLMVRKKSRLAVIEAGYNRNSRDDPEGLPDWFTEEETRFNRKQLPLTKELMAQYRAKMREINARPIRKEAEAQGRRKRRMEKKMTSFRQQAASLVPEDGDEGSANFGGIHKAKQIVRGMKAIKKEGKRKTVFLAVQRKGGASKQVGGDGGRGAKVAMVDRRLKKDRRGERNAKKGKGGRR